MPDPTTPGILGLVMRSKSAINDVLNRCDEAENDGKSAYPGMTYEQGVAYGIRWLTDDGPHPFED